MNGSANSSVKFPPSKKVNKGAKAIKKVIPIEISYDEYIKILNGWN